jgi:glycosyltransferase involved in cell wall biosynthesis
VVVTAHSGTARERAELLFENRPDVDVCGPIRTGRLRPVRLLVEVFGRGRPSLIYLIDIGASTTIVAVVAWIVRVDTIADTGDLAFELARTKGGRSRFALGVIYLGERFMVVSARCVVVRGLGHKALLPRQVTVYAPDVAPNGAAPRVDANLRRSLGLEDRFVVGLVGSLTLAPRLGTVYGWDLVEAIALLPDDVSALIVGDGDGRDMLETKATSLGVRDRCVFVGRVPSVAAAACIGLMDAAISTQTNNRVGAVRTTGKLPLYLACGCPVLASDVGEARRLLGPLGWTIRYEGIVDAAYPTRLAGMIARWAQDPNGVAMRRRQALEVSAQHFGVELVQARVQEAVESVLRARDVGA